jgi:hypothetical protein
VSASLKPLKCCEISEHSSNGHHQEYVEHNMESEKVRYTLQQVTRLRDFIPFSLFTTVSLG